MDDINVFDNNGRTKKWPNAAHPALRHRAMSPVDSTFSVSQILPRRSSKVTVNAFDKTLPDPPPDLPRMSSIHGSISPDPVFDGLESSEHYTDPTVLTSAPTSGDEHAEYDLKPPPPSVSHNNMELLAERFFSIDHLNLILRDPSLSARFSKFLHQYRPQHVASLDRYVESQKAAVAIEYANAIASKMHPGRQAATVSEEFEEHSHSASEDLLGEALPAALTQQLVRLVCESLVKEITQNSAPIMREMIPALAEVYCVTDPSLRDNPIVYASEEFYKTTQYGKEYVIGRNCRFLQGPKTSGTCIKRLIDALAAGEEITETILNYRRDGTPFMNLLMIAPLYDNKGNVRYFLGCQIDVSPLIENGRGIESFSQLLQRDRTESRFGGRPERDPKALLNELGTLFDELEVDSVKKHSRRGSVDTGRSTPTSSTRGGRRVLGMDDPADLWPSASLGPSGRLPGVYQNYLLVRPYPSLRITFTSPALRIPGLLQTKFLDRIGGPHHVREGILDALSHGTSVTAKISWLTGTGMPGQLERGTGVTEGKPRWVHCTPLLGSDEKVGVWMIVMVENEEVTGTLNARRRESDAASNATGVSNSRFTEDKLYSQYLMREGKDVSTPLGSTRMKSVSSPRGSSSGKYSNDQGHLGSPPHFHNF